MPNTIPMDQAILLNFEHTDFLTNYYDQKPVLLQSGISPSFTWSDLDKSIYASQSTPLGISLHTGHGFLPPNLYSDRCVEVGVVKSQLRRDTIHEHLNSGATLVFNRIESISLPVREICNALAALVGEEVVANGYAAFGEETSFGDHWDTHDVFAVQLIGRKQWTVYEPSLPYPLSCQTSKHQKHRRPSQPVMEIVLTPGDILYLPRGWWHSAVALNEPTFHIAAGVHTAKFIDYLRWLIDNTLIEHEHMRRTVRRASSEAHAMEAHLKIFSDEVSSIENWQAFKRHLTDQALTANSIDIQKYAHNRISLGQ